LKDDKYQKQADNHFIISEYQKIEVTDFVNRYIITQFLKDSAEQLIRHKQYVNQINKLFKEPLFSWVLKLQKKHGIKSLSINK
jgi:hypothetical protein